MFSQSSISFSMSQLNRIYEELEESLLESNVPDTLEERKQEIMTLLHEFNDVKDAAQIVIGTLAYMEGKTIKEIHLNYNLPLGE